MKKIQFLLACLLLLFLAFSALTRASEPVKPATVVKAAYTSLAGSKLPLWLATDRGYFKERGIEVEPIFLRTLTAVQALITGGCEIRLYRLCRAHVCSES
jgi:ABC-type nitrate/sulfonate/bicarbonate transport system substrate-binding protein